MPGNPHLERRRIQLDQGPYGEVGYRFGQHLVELARLPQRHEAVLNPGTIMVEAEGNVYEFHVGPTHRLWSATLQAVAEGVLLDQNRLEEWRALPTIERRLVERGNYDTLANHGQCDGLDVVTLREYVAADWTRSFMARLTAAPTRTRVSTSRRTIDWGAAVETTVA